MFTKNLGLRQTSKELQRQIADSLIADYGFDDGMEFAIVHGWHGVFGEILMRKPRVDIGNRKPNRKNDAVKRLRTGI